MFTNSAQHAAVNFGQFETYKFIPNSPTCMMLKPHKKGEGSPQRIMDSLPKLAQSLTAVAITYTLSGYSEDDVFIGQFPDNLFIEEEIIKYQKEFANELEKLEASQVERNKSLGPGVKYEFLMPSRVPRSIGI